jgi:hypothetical protein
MRTLRAVGKGWELKARVTVSLPQSVKKAAEELVRKNGVSLNQYVTLALAEKVRARVAVEFFAEKGKGGDAEQAAVFLEERQE